KVPGNVERQALQARTATAAREARELLRVTMETASDESAWIERAQKSDSSAFELLYRLHVDRVYALCLRMTGNTAEAEDCTQEAFIQAWRKLDRFRGDSSFGTWMH